MVSSLDRLVAATDKSDFKITKTKFGNTNDITQRKGVYPCEYIDNMIRIDETQ